LHRGFDDQPDLSTRQRTLIARWADRFAPDSLTDVQRDLLESAAPPGVSTEQREFAENQRELRSAYLANLFDSLSDDKQRAIQDPVRAGVTSDGYPLTVGELAVLTEASERQIRKWADEGLLPSHRQGRDRRFYSAAAIRACALVRAPGYSKAIAAAAARGEVGQHFQLLAATLARAAAKMPADLGGRLIALAEDISSSSRLMADVGDASELQALWREASLSAAFIAPPAVSAAGGAEGVGGAPPVESKARVVGRPVRLPPARKELTIPVIARKRSMVIECKLTDGPRNQPPLEISEADKILYAKYGGTKVFLKDAMVLTAPRGTGEWVNFVSGQKRALSVHETKADAEARGREVARKRHVKHVVFQRDGLIARSKSYS
jgi:excisionase family DNA binding protein